MRLGAVVAAALLVVVAPAACSEDCPGDAPDRLFGVKRNPDSDRCKGLGNRVAYDDETGCTYCVCRDEESCRWSLCSYGGKAGPRPFGECPGACLSGKELDFDGGDLFAGQDTLLCCESSPPPAFAYGMPVVGGYVPPDGQYPPCAHYRNVAEPSDGTCGLSVAMDGRVICLDNVGGVQSPGGCVYVACRDPSTCQWNLAVVGAENNGDKTQCPGAGEIGKPIPVCDDPAPPTVYGVALSSGGEVPSPTRWAPGYWSPAIPRCGYYGATLPCQYLVCQDSSSCDWLLSEVNSNHIGDRTECAGWGKQGMPVSP